MATLSLKKLLNQPRRNEVNHISRFIASLMVQSVKNTAIFRTWLTTEHTKKASCTQAFCTEAAEKKQKETKQKSNAKNVIQSTGRRIPFSMIQLIDENGEDKGKIHRADVFRIMDERGMKLILLSDKTDPPRYRLMTGKQIYEERLRIRDEQKASSKSGPVQQKEMKLSTLIDQHDLNTKIKQIQEWIEKKHHVKIILHQKHISDGPEKMLSFLDQILDTMREEATYHSMPRIVKEGRSVCVLRHLTNKEIQKLKVLEKNKDTQKENRSKTTDSDVNKQ